MPLEVDSKEIATDLSLIEDKLPTRIERIITCDGGYQEVNVADDFPSQKLCFYSVGINSFCLDDLRNIDRRQTINPSALKKLEDLERLTFVIPVQNIRLKKQDFKTTIRQTIYEIFKDNNLGDESKHALIHTIKWLVFKEYLDSPSKGSGQIDFACPHCGKMQGFNKQTQHYLDEKNNIRQCQACQREIYITDCLDLHTLVDDINGAALIESYVMSAFEVVLMLSMFRFFFEDSDIEWLTKTLFIKDGPLALFSRLDDFAFKVVRPFLQFLYEKSLKESKSYVNLVGLDKSGAFVEHLNAIKQRLQASSILLPNLNYMKKYITGDNASVFGENTYLGIKMLVKKDNNLSFVLDVAVPFDENVKYKDYIKSPNINDFLSLKSVLGALFELECNLYPMSFIPIAIINKIISLSNVPSKKILTIFSKEALQGKN